MAEVSNRQLNISLAGQIALNLDKQDEKGQDGKITKSVWDDFWSKNGAEFKGKNENVGEDGISVREAMGLIMTRLYNAAKATGKSVDEIAKNLFKEAGGEKIDANTVKFADEETTPVNDSNPVEETKPVEEVKTQEEKSPVKKSLRVADAPPLEVPPPDFSKIPRRGKNYSNYNIISDYRQKAQAVYNNREQTKKNSQQYLDYLSGKIRFIEPTLKPDNAAYTASELFNNGIYNKYKDSDRMRDVICGIVEGLVRKAESLGIKYDKQKLHASNFTDRNKWKTNGIVEEMRKLVNKIIMHDNTAINDFNAIKAMQTPNKQNAGKIIVDKATGNRYCYDKNGYIDWISDNKNGNKFHRYSDGSYGMNNKNGWIAFDKNGKVVRYMEKIKVYGKTTNVWRNSDGMIYQALYDVGNNSCSIRYFYNENGNCYEYCIESHEGGKPYIDVHRKSDGTLLYYTEFDDNVMTYKDQQGNIIKYCKNVNNDPGSLDAKWIYYNKEGKEISEKEFKNIYPYD